MIFRKLKLLIVNWFKEVKKRIRFSWMVITDNYGKVKYSLDLDYTRDILIIRKQILSYYKKGYDIDVVDHPELLLLRVYVTKYNKSGLVHKSFDVPYEYMLAVNVDMDKATNYEILKMKKEERDAVTQLKSELVQKYANKIIQVFGKGY